MRMVYVYVRLTPYVMARVRSESVSRRLFFTNAYLHSEVTLHSNVVQYRKKNLKKKQNKFNLKSDFDMVQVLFIVL